MKHLLALLYVWLSGCAGAQSPAEHDSSLPGYGVTVLLWSSPTGVVYTMQGRAVTAAELEAKLSRTVSSSPSLSALVKITDNTTIREAASLRSILDRANLTNVHYHAILTHSNIVYHGMFDPPRPMDRNDPKNQTDWELLPVQSDGRGLTQ